MRRTVALIIGTPYSGSSLLNLLLDSQPAIRGLGEAVNLLSSARSAPCSRCGETVMRCPLYGAADRSRFYGSLFDCYKDAAVLIDSSKDFTWCFGAHAYEADFDYKAIVLSKAPHEFVSSWLGHHPGSTPRAAFERYIDTYDRQLDWLSRQPWFSRDKCERLMYRRLASRPRQTLESLCGFLNATYSRNPAWWRTNSHIIGGNGMVSAQIAPEATSAPIELTRKYRGRYHTIFYDSQWRSDAEQQRACALLYNEFGTTLEPLLEALGQPDCRQLLAELNQVIPSAHSA